MKLKFIATAQAPGYTINGEIITATYNGQSQEFVLSDFPEGALFEGVESTLDLIDQHVIRDVERDGELKVTLCQMAPVTKVTYVVDGKMIHKLPNQPEPESYDRKIEHRGGHWAESGWIDANNYDPEKLYIQEK